MSSHPTRINTFANIESDDKLDDFAPKPLPKASPTPVASRPSTAQQDSAALTISRVEEKTMVAKLAQDSGFSITNHEEEILPARKVPAPQTKLKTVRLRVSDWNRFQRWCTDKRYSHWEGFSILASTLPPTSGAE